LPIRARAFQPRSIQNFSKNFIAGSNAQSTEGSGLGLALVNRIVALHGGVVDVRSNQRQPRGTVFTVRLPVRQ
jgi:signal transduction histidine kinase